MQLSAQSIRRLCTGDQPMISPFVGEKTVVNGTSFGLSVASYDVRIAHDLVLEPGDFSLAHTLEDLAMPSNVCAVVADKSTYARRGVSAFNTFIDPGFCGNLTLELKNLGNSTVSISAGDAICQLVFMWLDEKTDRPYSGKFQNQPRRSVGARFEKSDGTYDEL